jgi:hypothetical protein
MDDMKSRYEAALGKIIVAEISIFSLEAGSNKEVILHDFVIEENVSVPLDNEM